MNLRVDLILPTEQRSASPLSSKSLVRIGVIVIPAILFCLVAAQVIMVNQLKRDIRDLRLSYETAKPQQELARKLVAEFQVHRQIEAELDGWRTSRIPWSKQFAGLVRLVPENVHLDTLSINQSMRFDNAVKLPARHFTMTIRGRATGQEAEQSVQALEAGITHGNAFTGLTERVSVPQYGADTAPGANPNDRLFQLECSYAERRFQ